MKYNQKFEQIDNASVYAALSQNPPAFVKETERRYLEQIQAISKQAVEEHKHIILVTGPSASGKTTTAKRIESALIGLGKKVNRIALDNFYKPAHQLPRWEDGYQNYESVEGLDIPLFEEKMHQLFTTGKAVFPHFLFVDGVREENGFSLSYDDHTYLILEGIHALNPRLTEVVKDYAAIHIYISTHSEFVSSDNRALLSPRELRLARRILRDYLYRGTSAKGTLEMWDYVLRGEDLYIRPYRQYADIHIDSTHAYEPYLYQKDLIPLLEAIPADSGLYPPIQGLVESKTAFFPISYDLIPQSSLIQEFIRPGFLEQQKITLRR